MNKSNCVVLFGVIPLTSFLFHVAAWCENSNEEEDGIKTYPLWTALSITFHNGRNHPLWE